MPEALEARFQFAGKAIHGLAGTRDTILTHPNRQMARILAPLTSVAANLRSARQSMRTCDPASGGKVHYWYDSRAMLLLPFRIVSPLLFFWN